VEYKGYVARVEYEPEAGVLFGQVEGVRDVITFEASGVDELRKAFEDSVDDYLEMCAERGEEPDKPYSGKFVVRLDPELHRDVALAAAREGKSLNSLATEAFANWLEMRGPTKKELRSARANASVSEGKGTHYRIPGPPVLAEIRQGTNARANAIRFNQDTPASQTPGSITPPSILVPNRGIQ
jgi:predicted HicB family RNase H-like nuclease